MKWLFLLAMILFAPMLTAILRSNPKYLLPCCVALGAMPFFVSHELYIGMILWDNWSGPVKGFEVSIIDAMSLAILLSTARVRTPLSIKIAFGIVVLSVIVSSLASYYFMPAMFYAFQIVRTLVLFLAVVRVCGTVDGAPIAIVTGLGLGLCYEAILATFEYLSGVERPGGNLGHANLLGLSSHFVVYPALAYLLAGKRGLLFATILGCGLLIAIVGGSRATLGLIAIGMLLTIFLSLLHRASGRKFAFGGAAIGMLLIAAPAMFLSVAGRSDEAKASSDLERKAMHEASRMMIADHPLGIGANQYAILANVGGYSERAGVHWGAGSRHAPVHNYYYLVTAELGLLGFIGFVALLATLILHGFSGLRRYKSNPLAELIPGLIVTLVVVSVHIYYEWVFVHFVIHHLFAIGAGMLVGVKQMLRRSSVQSPTKSSVPISNGWAPSPVLVPTAVVQSGRSPRTLPGAL